MQIKEALGLGEKFTTKSGATITVVPCSLGDLEDAQTRWELVISSQYSMQMLYSPKKKDDQHVQETRAALEWLLIKASGQEVPDDEKERYALAKPLLKPFNVKDYGEVLDYIMRFLGYLNGGTTSDQENEELEIE